MNITRVHFVSSITFRLNLVLQHYYCVVIGQSHLLIHVYGDTRSTHYQNFQVFLGVTICHLIFKKHQNTPAGSNTNTQPWNEG